MDSQLGEPPKESRFFEVFDNVFGSPEYKQSNQEANAGADIRLRRKTSTCESAREERSKFAEQTLIKLLEEFRRCV